MDNLANCATVAALYLSLWKCSFEVTKTATTEDRRLMCSPILILALLNFSGEIKVAWWGKLSLLVLACDCRKSCKNGCLTNRLVLAGPRAVFDVTDRVRRAGRLDAEEELANDQRRWYDGYGSPVDTMTRHCFHR